MKKLISTMGEFVYRNKCTKYSVFTLLGVFLSCILALSIYVGMVYYIKNIGIDLGASKDYPVEITDYYRQNDPNWKNESIGNTTQQMGSTGCLISCVSTAITNLGFSINPKEFNDLLTQNDGFQGANLVWYKINEAIPEVDYSYKRIFGARTIENDLKKGLLPIVNVKYYKTGITHWVLIVGAKEGEFLILDPLGDGNSTMLLSDHGRVYAYRVMQNAQS